MDIQNNQIMQNVGLDDLIKQDRQKRKPRQHATFNNRKVQYIQRQAHFDRNAPQNRHPQRREPFNRPQNQFNRNWQRNPVTYGQQHKFNKPIWKNRVNRNVVVQQRTIEGRFETRNQVRSMADRRAEFNTKRSQFLASRQFKAQENNNKQESVQDQERTLKAMGLHPDFTNEDLYKLFSTQGALQKCLIEQDNFGRSLTTAIIKYHNNTSAKNAIQNLNQHKIMNSILTVEPYKK